MGSLTTPEFFRYSITVLLDMFISSVIQEILLYKFEEPICELKDSKHRYVKFVGNNIDNILQSLVAIITFYAYTNKTRFLWTYPDNTIPQDKVIQTSTIQLSTVISGVVFLASTFSKLNKMGNPIGVKLIFVIIAIVILSLGSVDMMKNFINMIPQQKYSIKFDMEKCTKKYCNNKKNKFVSRDLLES